MYTNMELGEEESVLFREMSLFQGCHCIAGLHWLVLHTICSYTVL